MGARIAFALVAVAIGVALLYSIRDQPQYSTPHDARVGEALSTPSAGKGDIAPAPDTPFSPARQADSDESKKVPPPSPTISSPAAPAAREQVISPEAPRFAERLVAAVSPDEAVLERDLLQVHLMVRKFRDAVGENPVGTNAEIMSALEGDNLKQARIGPPENQQINDKGELIDRWGTPYFFHQLSKTKMEIRSAGPDKVMWTADDKQL